ncbi:MAG: RagB/SusD family nutrient uptake outer membrane protein [Gemmatimonadaceae bacterium]|nr:RagB/SusD family nutrient uptake outer membrane protein [Gemmatimonadaceae bacterium]
MKIVSKHPLLVGMALLALATGTIYGCSDFLTDSATPQGTLNEGTLANRAGVEGTLIGAYRPLDCTNTSGAWGCAASNWVWSTVASDESYKGSTGSDQPPINDIEGYHWGSAKAEDYLNQKWSHLYEGVVRSNAALRLLKSVVASSPGEFTAAEASSIEGEALFLRAHYHFEAYRMWGNIPYYHEDDTDFRKANETSDQVVADLLADLDAAIELLPATPRNGEKGRATSWAAKAYQGRVQVYAGQFAAAVTTLKDVRDNGPYALEQSYDRVWTGFSDFANGRETILAYQASANDGEPNGNNANFGERLNFPNGGHFGCCGFNQPTQNLVNFFRVDAAGLPLALSDPANWNANDANFTSADLAPVDPRLDWTVGREGVPLKDWGLYTVAAYARDVANGGPYAAKKNIHENTSGAEQLAGGWAPTQQNSVNIHLFRYADMLLLLADAMVETGDLSGATAMVNLVRARAGQTAQGPGTDRATIAVPINSPSITWAVYRVSQYPTAFSSQAYGREAVRAERRLELAMEGQRLFDLRRWGIAATALNGYLTGMGGGREDTRRLYLANAEAFTARHALYPIPNIQIELSKVGSENRLTQNPGW